LSGAEGAPELIALMSFLGCAALVVVPGQRLVKPGESWRRAVANGSLAARLGLATTQGGNG